MKLVHEAPLTVNTESDPIKDGMYLVYTRLSPKTKTFQRHLLEFRKGRWSPLPVTFGSVYGWIGPLPNLKLEE